MSELSNSVIMPREDFLELQAVAYDNSHVPTLGERAANTGQALVVFAGIAAAVTAGTWGWAAARDWFERRQTERWHETHQLN